MSESLDGVNVVATRQNAGRSANARPASGGAPPRAAVGGANAPAATESAAVIVAFGILSDRRRSQLASAPRAASAIVRARAAARIVLGMIRGSYDNRRMRVALFSGSITLALVTVSAAPAPAPVDPGLLSSLHWRSIGPAATGGRIDDFAVARVPGAPDAIYV